MVFNEGKLRSEEDQPQAGEVPIVDIAEPTEPKLEFQGEDAEVTAERTSGEKDGGWEYRGANFKSGHEGEVIIGKGAATKSIKMETLREWQPFKKGEKTPVIRSDKSLDSEGWTISEVLGNGRFEVERMIDGQPKIKKLKKSQLIKAKIGELKLEERGLDAMRSTESGRGVDDSASYNRIKKGLEYWEAKLETATRLGINAERRAARAKNDTAINPMPGFSNDIVEGETPNLDEEK